MAMPNISNGIKLPAIILVTIPNRCGSSPNSRELNYNEYKLCEVVNGLRCATEESSFWRLMFNASWIYPTASLDNTGSTCHDTIRSPAAKRTAINKPPQRIYRGSLFACSGPRMAEKIVVFKSIFVKNCYNKQNKLPITTKKPTIICLLEISLWNKTVYTKSLSRIWNGILSEKHNGKTKTMALSHISVKRHKLMSQSTPGVNSAWPFYIPVFKGTLHFRTPQAKSGYCKK